MAQNPSKADLARQVGKHVRWIRELKGWSKRQAAISCEAYPANWTLYERGERLIPQPILHAFCRLFDVPIEFVFDGITDRMDPVLRDRLKISHPRSAAWRPDKGQDKGNCTR